MEFDYAYRPAQFKDNVIITKLSANIPIDANLQMLLNIYRLGTYCDCSCVVAHTDANLQMLLNIHRIHRLGSYTVIVPALQEAW